MALGRGLDALISTDFVKTQGSSSINEVPLNQIHANPDQPRRDFDQESLEELAESLREIGIIQPITLRKMAEGDYQIIAGERRFRAAGIAGLKTIPAYIRTADDENVMAMALIENIQREDLNSMEVALACQNLLEVYNMTQEQLSSRIGKKRATIANYNQSKISITYMKQRIKYINQCKWQTFLNIISRISISLELKKKILHHPSINNPIPSHTVRTRNLLKTI